MSSSPGVTSAHASFIVWTCCDWMASLRSRAEVAGLGQSRQQHVGAAPSSLNCQKGDSDLCRKHQGAYTKTPQLHTP